MMAHSQTKPKSPQPQPPSSLNAMSVMGEHSYVETVCYILMGLSVLVVFKQLFALSPTACYWIIAEGVCYITGAAFYSLRKARYMHSVFHFFVLGGSAFHMVAVWDILVKML